MRPCVAAECELRRLQFLSLTNLVCIDVGWRLSVLEFVDGHHVSGLILVVCVAAGVCRAEECVDFGSAKLLYM